MNNVKELTVNGLVYTFVYDERYNSWWVMEDDSLIDNYAVALEVEVKRPGGEVDWEEITGFIEYLTGEKQEINENLDNAQTVMKAFFNANNKEYFSDEFLKDVIFEPFDITYNGLFKKDDTTPVFEYSFVYFPYYAHHGEDLGAYSWEANFRGDQFLGVKRNIS
ncbi:hypothetical protein [Niastella yeongjuensis]|nr:hypothetical protein [Niastella yeongjuensis]SEO26021.1 hypothetical protein SAMN05660816_02415 [Niastella yeongjuensis]